MDGFKEYFAHTPYAEATFCSKCLSYRFLLSGAGYSALLVTFILTFVLLLNQWSCTTQPPSSPKSKFSQKRGEELVDLHHSELKISSLV